MLKLGVCVLGFLFTACYAQLPLETPEFDVFAAVKNRSIDLSSYTKDTGDNVLTSVACTTACGILKTSYGTDQVLLEGSREYQNFTEGYWSAQQINAQPKCIFYPHTASEVSTVVLLSRLTRCPFAVKSGGHAAMAGASSSVGGITVALENINDIILSKDKTTVAVGAGNTWSRIYERLEPEGVQPVGGRVKGIGVGGYLTGGGLSFLSNLHGWACDNVESFEVVLANGEIVMASEDSNPDLYWALRGGGNNFGIVTKFNLFVYPLTVMHGGSRFYSENIPELIKAYHEVSLGAETDGKAQGWCAMGIFKGSPFAVAELAYTDNDPSPSIYAKYRDLESVQDSTAERTLLNYTLALKEYNPYGLHQIFHTVTTELNLELATWAHDELLQDLKSIEHLDGSTAAYILHTISIPMLEKMSKRGGNALGISTADGPLQIHQINVYWNKEEHIPAAYQFADMFLTKVHGEARKRGIAKDYIYMNYASLMQDVIGGYGAENKQKLKDIAKRYDPKGVYQTLQPGYFKLDGGPYDGYKDWAAKNAVGAATPRHDEL